MTLSKELMIVGLINGSLAGDVEVEVTWVSNLVIR